jgi:RNA polymerase primary sigma factor
MIAGLCESPLTFQAIIIWREELNEGKTFCATSSIWRPPIPVPRPRARRSSRARKRSRPTARWPRKRKRPAPKGQPTTITNVGGESQNFEEDDEDDDENNLSLAAMEAELRPQVMETLDTIAETYKKLRKLQDQQVEAAWLPPARCRRRRSAATRKLKDEADHRGQVAVAQPEPHRGLVEQLYDINKRLVSNEGRLLRWPKATV